MVRNRNNPLMIELNQFNRMDEATALAHLRQCCTSGRWATRMAASRPYDSIEAMLAAADRHWGDMAEADFLEAFDGHPKIGDPDSLKRKYAATHALASSEQSGVSEASDDVIARLAHGNTEYEQKFGFIFIVCATGKSAAEMLELIEARLHHSRDRELAIAAEEQRKITAIRISKQFATTL